MSSNKDIIHKADIALADLSNNGGLLLPEQADTFIRTLIDQPTILQNARVVAMNSPQRKINKIGFGSRILHPAVSGTALASGDRSKPDLGQVSLNTKEVIAEVNIPYDVIEDNIERGNVGGAMQQGAGGLHDTIVQLIAERAALDLEELCLLGDTASADPYLAMLDGFLKKANVNAVAANAVMSKNVLKAGIKAMPDKYLRNRSQLVQFMSVDNETELRDSYGNRQTAAGDAHLSGELPLYMHGTRVQGVPLMPASNGLFTNPLNLIFGIQRKINIEYDKDIRARVFIVVLTARVDAAIEQTDAVVKYTGIQ